MKSDTDIEIVLAGDDTSDDLVAEIYFRGRFVAAIVPFDGDYIVDVPGSGLDETLIERRVPLAVLDRAIELAKARLG